MIGARVYLSIGSNVGAREAAVLRAVGMLDDRAVRVSELSCLYETEPVGCAPMGTFVNAVVEVRSLLSPEDLLERLQAIERVAGRRGGHNQPRVLDMDIVAYGDEVIRSARLTIPHARYRRRLFVLLPLREIAPEFLCPATGQGIDTMLARLEPGQSAARVSSRRVVAASAGDLRRRLELQHG
jgi:2-amino-4-hydroxy-6-hydroxymethyldihydropteridine diphosphokinase